MKDIIDINYEISKYCHNDDLCPNCNCDDCEHYYSDIDTNDDIPDVIWREMIICNPDLE